MRQSTFDGIESLRSILMCVTGLISQQKFDEVMLNV